MIQVVFATIQELDQHRTLLAVCLPITGGMLAACSSVLVPRGRSKGVITGAYLLFAGLGLACLCFGVVAVALGARVSSITPVLLPGIVLTAVMGLFTSEVVRQYQFFEIRKLAAEIFRRT